MLVFRIDGTGLADGARLILLTVIVPPGEGQSLDSWGGMGSVKSVWSGIGAILCNSSTLFGSEIG